jgi:hypothetical protein
MTVAEALFEATVALDDILAPPQIHQVLYDGLVPPGHSRGFAFCVLGYARDPSRTFVLLRGKRDALPKGAQPMAPVTQGDTFDFTLKANAEHSHGGKRMPYARHDIEGRELWLRRVADRAGFELLDLIELETRTQRIEDRKRQVRFPVTTWTGTIRIKDLEAFTQFLLSGCGKGRAWGFGTINLFDVANTQRDAA